MDEILHNHFLIFLQMLYHKQHMGFVAPSINFRLRPFRAFYDEISYGQIHRD